MSDNTENDLRARFLAAMRNVAHSVTVVTTNEANTGIGATVSAFSSVSADPPTVLVCLRTESRIAGAVARVGRFNVNILTERQMDLASRFAGFDDDLVKDRFDGVKIETTPNDCPAIAGSIAFCCRLTNRAKAGTHTVFFGEVENLIHGNEPPLVYHGQLYHRTLEIPRSNKG